VSEEHLWNMLVACSDPVSGETVGSLPRRSGSALSPASIFVSARRIVLGPLGSRDDETREVIADCHRQAIDYVISYAEKEVFHSRSGKNGSSKRTSPGSSGVIHHFTSRSDDPRYTTTY